MKIEQILGNHASNREAHRGTKKQVAFISAVSVAVLLSACTARFSEKELEKFGAAAKSTTELLSTSQTAYVQLITFRNEETGFGKLIGPQRLKSPKGIFAPRLNRLEPEVFEVRIQLLNAISKYVDALTKINDPDFRSKIETAVKGLFNSTTAFGGAVAPATAIPVITPIMNLLSKGVSYLIVESNYSLAMKVIREVDPLVQEATNLLLEDFRTIVGDMEANLNNWRTQAEGRIEKFVRASAYRPQQPVKCSCLKDPDCFKKFTATFKATAEAACSTNQGDDKQLVDRQEPEKVTLPNPKRYGNSQVEIFKIYVETRRRERLLTAQVRGLQKYEKLLKGLAAAHHELAKGQPAQDSIDSFFLLVNSAVSEFQALKKALAS